MNLYIDGKVNKIAAAGGRQVNCLPYHFESIKIIGYNESQIKNWIWKNLNGRFYLGPKYKIENGSVIYEHVAAFEDPAEATMFVLMAETISEKDPFYDFI